MRLDSPVQESRHQPQSGQPAIYIRNDTEASRAAPNETEASGKPFQSDVKIERDPYIPQISGQTSPRRIIIEKVPVHETNQSR